MRLILTGQKSFGAAALDSVASGGHDIAYAVTRPDDKLDLAAARLRIPVRYSLDAADVTNANADLIVCAHGHDYIGRKSRGATRLGALVGHPSLLPRHRGKSAVEWTTRMHDPIAGFTWFWADNGVDTGPVAWQDWCHVDPAWDHHDLWSELFRIGQVGLLAVLRDLDLGRVVAIPQDERVATREPAIEAARLYRPELPAIGAGPAGFDVIASREDSRLRP